MLRQVVVTNQTRSLSGSISAGYYDRFFDRLRGLMFQPGIKRRHGVLLVQERENRIDAAIHMLFCNFELAIIWINSENKVVDTCLARRWRPYYMPARPAKYILETHPDHLPEFQEGDQLAFSNAPLD
jgi:uncharacterized membrane protein (UPF0127 family)